jgi:hypothetical protein
MNRPYNYYFLRALHERGATHRPPAIETIVLATFYEIVIFKTDKKSGFI